MSPLRQRVHNLRRRLIAASVALFIALFGGITIQLASGHDPMLKSDKATTTSSNASSSGTTTPSTTSSSSTTSPSTSTGGSSTGQTTLAPMTTSQS